VSYLVATIRRSDSRFDRIYWRAVGLVPSWLQWLVPKPVPKSWLATEAAAILPELGPAARSAIPALVASLKTGNPLLNHAARDALGRIRPRFDELAPCLGELAKQGDCATVCALIQDLHFRGSATVPLLCEALRTTDRQARRTALMLLEQQGPNAARAVPLLVTTLHDPDSEVRYLTARTLGEIGTNARPALEALKRACHDTNVMVQNASARAIRKIAPGEHDPAPSDGQR
jgi:HEAT repeat protein